MRRNIHPHSKGSVSRGPVHRSGFAYLLTLTVITVVALVALVFGRGVAQHLRTQSASVARAQCEQAALGMIRAVANDLEAARTAGKTPALSTVNPAGERIGDCVVMLIGRDPNGAKVVFGMIPESGKLDVNTAKIEQLAALPGMTTALAAAITDWRDADDDVDAQGGAERNDGAYAGAAVPYAPRNAPLESLDELRLVRGMTDAVYFGEDVKQNGVLDSGEDTNGDGKLTPGLRDLLTLDSREPALAPDGTAKVNVLSVNNAMHAFLSNQLGNDRGAEVILALTQAERQKPRFATRLGFLAAARLTDDEAEKIWPFLSGPEGRVGLIDAYTCREEVLAAAVGSDLAKTIVAARPITAPASPLWLANILKADPAAGSLFTFGSYQFTLDVLAVRIDGAGYARMQALIDVSGTAARVSNIRPSQTQGWPLPWITPEKLRASPPGSDPVALLSTIPR